MTVWLAVETIPIWKNRGCRGKPQEKKKDGTDYEKIKHCRKYRIYHFSIAFCMVFIIFCGSYGK